MAQGPVLESPGSWGQKPLNWGMSQCFSLLRAAVQVPVGYQEYFCPKRAAQGGDGVPVPLFNSHMDVALGDTGTVGLSDHRGYSN